MRFAARITADPALSRTRNGSRTLHVRFAAEQEQRQDPEQEQGQNEKQEEGQQGKGEQKAQKRPASDAGLHIISGNVLEFPCEGRSAEDGCV